MPLPYQIHRLVLEGATERILAHARYDRLSAIRIRFSHPILEMVLPKEILPFLIRAFVWHSCDDLIGRS